MFQRWIQKIRAERALRAERFEEALSLLDDPMFGVDRRVQDLRGKVFLAWKNRAERRLANGRPELAVRDLERLAALDPDSGELDDLRLAVEEALRAKEGFEARRAELRRRFDRALDGGRLHEAEACLEEGGSLLEEEERKTLEARLESRRRAASRCLERAREAMRGGFREEAREALERAHRLRADSMVFRDRLVKAGARWARKRWEEVRVAMEAGKPLEAAFAFHDWWEREPRPEDYEEARDLKAAIGGVLGSEADLLAAEGRFEEALALLRRVPGPVSGLPSLRRLSGTLERLLLLVADRGEDPRRALRELRRIQAERHWKGLEKALEEAEKGALKLESGIEAARADLARGEVEEGRRRLEDLARAWPDCSEVRLLLDGLEQDEAERRGRLDRAREAVREGRLCEAEALLLSLVGGGAGAEEAQNLLRDVERLRTKVLKEVAALEAAFEAGGAAEEVRKGLGRIEALQSDSPEARALQARIEEAGAREARLAAFSEALEARRPKEAVEVLRLWLEEGGGSGLGLEDREALGRAGAKLMEHLEEELAAGAAASAADLCKAIEDYAAFCGLTLEDLADRALARVREAEARAEEGLAHLEECRVEEAEEALERARAAAQDAPQVLRLAHKLVQVERGRAEIREIRDLAENDPFGARDRLAALGPTPAPLRTLVFRAREDLARRGDLEGGCRLQVEEGGEFLVLTGDRLRIGNATAPVRPQISVLARIRPHHATLERRLSFHGGFRDRIEAFQGALVEVDGRPVEQCDLGSGDRILLGGILPIRYLRPHPRSLSSLLRLEKGFECEGTSRILWIKQGGRDGALFFGRGPDKHVRLPRPEKEVALFVKGPGDFRLSFAGRGTIDGRPFQGEVRLHPGAELVCGQVAFRILPL